MQFHNSPPFHMKRIAGHITNSSFISPSTMGADNTNPIEKFRLLGEKRERCGGCSAHSQHSAWSGIESRDNAAPGIPQYENPDSSPFDIVPRSWEKADPRISGGFLCGKLHHLFIFWPLNALANAKSLSIFERNYKFPFYLMSCKRPGLEKFRPKMNPRII